MAGWLAQNWVSGALVMAVVLLALTPLLWRAFPLTLILIYLHSPAYMLHQVEEHRGDRFRTFVNQRMFGGIEALTTEAVLWINLPGVWGINLVAFLAAWHYRPALGLVAPYMVLVNAVGHILSGIAFRGYNPGLWTSLILFLPLGSFTLWKISHLRGTSILHHMIGLGCALATHAIIAFHIRSNVTQALGESVEL